MTKYQNAITFRSDTNIGAPAAEDDFQFLEECFVDTGYLIPLGDVNQPNPVVVGRTGSGKSALMHMLSEREENVCSIDPEEFALKHIANSNIIQFFEDLGVNLDPFYQLLWKHVICIELIKLRYHPDDDAGIRKVLDGMTAFVAGDRGRERALNYFREWGDEDIWIETEARVREVTTRFEKDLKAGAGVANDLLNLGVEGAQKLSQEEKTEYRSRAQRVVNKVQMNDLHKVITALSEYSFSDQKRRFYIVIDDLDKDWAEDRIRFKLIKALIEAQKRFGKIQTVKIVVSIRTDLLQKVFDETRSAGFQEDKYEGAVIRIRWNDGDLRSLADRRISAMFKRKYTRDKVGFSDVFPEKVREIDAFKYLMQRTHRRPRDVIMFINNCFQEASGQARVSQRTMIRAEALYSEKRLKNLLQEWILNFPLLGSYVDVLRGRPKRFQSHDFIESDLSDLIVGLSVKGEAASDPVGKIAIDLAERQSKLEYLTDYMSAISEMISIFHLVGLVGLKYDEKGEMQWTDQGSAPIQPSIIQTDTYIHIHPMFWRALGIRGGFSGDLNS